MAELGPHTVGIPVDRMTDWTDTTENITFLLFNWRAVIMTGLKNITFQKKITIWPRHALQKCTEPHGTTEDNHLIHDSLSRV